MSETVNILDFEFEVDILSSTPFDPGRTSGPPEHCYPPEGGEIEWEVNPDQPIAEFIMAAVEKNSDWESSIEISYCKRFLLMNQNRQNLNQIGSIK